VFTAQMKGRVSALLLGLGIAIAPAARSQDPVNQYGNPFKHPPKPTTAAITAEELRTRLYIFADDSMQGRKVGYVGNMKGTAYIASELKRLGVEPAGDNGGYFQRLPWVLRKFNGTPSLSVNGAALTYMSDFLPVAGARAPKEINGVAVIYGGVEGDTTKQITPEQAAGKFVIMSPAPAGAGGGNAQFGGRGGGGGGGRGGAGGGGGAAARFPDAVAVAVVDLDALSQVARMEIANPTLAQDASGGGRGGAAPAVAPGQPMPGGVPTPNPAFKGTAGDIVVTTGRGVAIVRDGKLVAGTLPAGSTAASVQASADSIKHVAALITAGTAVRRDSLAAFARGLAAGNARTGTFTFYGETLALDSGQIATLSNPAGAGGRGGAAGGGRGGPVGLPPAGAGAIPANAAAGAAAAAGGANGARAGGGRAGGGGGGRGRGGAAGGGAAPAAVPTAITASFHISTAAAAKLLGKSLDGLAPGATGGTATAKLDWSETPSDWARNVVGIVRGSDPVLKNEYVAIGAHNHDSLKAYNNERLKLQMQVVQGDLRALPGAMAATIKVNMDSIRKIHPVARLDSIQNGADDDGSGSMGVLEIAEAIAKMPIKPKRSIIFVWHTGEEGGLLGSRYFAANPTVPLDSIVAQINIDMIGRGRAEDMVGGGPNYLGAVGSQRLSTELNHEMLAVNAHEPEGKKLRIDYRFDDPTLGTAVDGKPISWPGYNNIYGRSDHANYANKCVPIVFFFTGLHGDYHQITDEPQYIDYPHYSMIDNYIRDLLVDVANKPTRPALDHPCTRQ